MGRGFDCLSGQTLRQNAKRRPVLSGTPPDAILCEMR